MVGVQQMQIHIYISIYIYILYVHVYLYDLRQHIYGGAMRLDKYAAEVVYRGNRLTYCIIYHIIILR